MTKPKAPHTVVQNCVFHGSPTSEAIAAARLLAEACTANAKAIEQAAKVLAGPQVPFLQFNDPPGENT